MQNPEKSNVRAQVLGIACDGEQGLRGGAEQDGVHDRFVLKGEGGNLLGEREDHVKVLDRQQLRLALLQPLGPRQALTFWAMSVAAGVVADARKIAVIALVDMAGSSL